MLCPACKLLSHMQSLMRSWAAMTPAPLNLRELRGLDKAMQTIRGDLTNNIVKLCELDGYIALDQRKLAVTKDADEFTRRRIAERLRSLEDERSSRLEAAAASQETRNEDTTLAESIRTLFREQGSPWPVYLLRLGRPLRVVVGWLHWHPH